MANLPYITHFEVLFEKNLAFAKQVAIVYTTDNWTTFHNAFGSFQRTFPPPTMPHQIQSELWAISVQLTPGASGQFAVFYIVGGATYWDNNFGAKLFILRVIGVRCARVTSLAETKFPSSAWHVPMPMRPRC